jgi:hypothetical protein
METIRTRQLEAENAKLRRALRPFAEIDIRVTWRGLVPSASIAEADVKRARTVLNIDRMRHRNRRDRCGQF